MRDGQLYVPPAIEERARDLVCRHLAGEPVAYLIGEWEFYGLPLDISESVLIPRPDTEVLADHVAMRWLRPPAGAPGAGSVRRQRLHRSGRRQSRSPAARVVLGELDEGALAHLPPEHPPQRPQRPGGVPADGRSVRAAVPGWGILTVIVCNPPYIPTGDIAGLDVSVRDYEPHLALDGGDGRAGLLPQRSAENWRDALHPGGRLLFEVGIGQADDVLRHHAARRASASWRSSRIPAGIPRVVYGTLRYQ